MIVGIGAAITTVVWAYRIKRVERISVITGAVLEADVDPKRQQPVATVQITAQFGPSLSGSKSDASGLFRITLRPPVDAGDLIRLMFRHPNYQDLETSIPAERLIHVIRLTPKPRSPETDSKRAPIGISDVRVRYAMKNTATTNVGSTVKTFEVVNTGNVPCDRKGPCSPDGRWKAEVGSLSLDAGMKRSFATCACPVSQVPVRLPGLTRMDTREAAA